MPNLTPGEHSAVLRWACDLGRFQGGHEVLHPSWPRGLKSLATSKAPETMEQHRFRIVVQTINAHNGNILAAAKELDLSRCTIYEIMRHRGLKARDAKPQKPAENIIQLKESAA